MANAATFDVMRDAEPAEQDRLEVNEPLETPSRSQRQERRLARQSGSTERWHRFVVDVWLTDLNPTEFGIFKRSRNRSKSHQFTKDMDVYAEVIENGKRTGILGWRKQLWRDNDRTRQRLVLKLFTDKLNWQATMDLMLARSIQQTIGARGIPVATYSINARGEDQVVYIERSANKWPFMPENWSFFLLRDGHLDFFRIRQKFIRWGDDYLVYNGRGQEIGKLDGALLSLAGKWRCRIEKSHVTPHLLATLKMFTGMLIFNNRARRHISQCAEAVRKANYRPTLERQEVELYLNPRRVR